MPTLETYKGTYLWKYIPNLPAAITFAILFLILTILHTWRMIKHRTWFCIPFVVGGFCEPIGYASRAISTHHTGSLLPYLLQAIFILLPPCLFAGTLYMIYSRVVRALHGSSFSLISPRWCTRIFVAGDFLCLNIQSGGAGCLPHEKLAKYGNGIIVAGLALQVVIFTGFMYCCLVFHRRFRTHLAREGRTVDGQWEAVLGMLYVTSVVISVRNVFRLVEFVAGHESYLFLNEWPVYVFDGVLMLVVMVVYYVWYPPQLQPTSSDSMIELTSEDDSPESAHGRVEKHSRRTS
ncbi:Nn.00g040070.m01.CDS01 [Neocucurbitaria sp. VM-36]